MHLGIPPQPNRAAVTRAYPEMTRYFMTISEVVQLVLQAAVFGCGGEVFVLDSPDERYALDTIVRRYEQLPVAAPAQARSG